MSTPTFSSPKSIQLPENPVIRVFLVGGGLIGVAVVVLISATIAGLIYMDYAFPMTVDSAYADRAAAEADSLFTRGWLPRDMPATMDDMHVRTNVDIGIAWSTFQTDEAGVAHIRSEFKAVSSSVDEWPRKSGTRWWPDELRNDEALTDGSWEIYSCGDRSEFRETAFLALDPKSYQVYYWLR